MLRYVILCYVMLCYVMLCDVILCYLLLQDVTSVIISSRQFNVLYCILHSSISFDLQAMLYLWVWGAVAKKV